MTKPDEVEELAKELFSLTDTSSILWIELSYEKQINEYNLSPKPDIINDCEVRRQGFNFGVKAAIQAFDQAVKERDSK